VTVFVGDVGDGRKSLPSPKIRRSYRFRNFGFRSKTIIVVAQKSGYTFGISASRATPVYI